MAICRRVLTLRQLHRRLRKLLAKSLKVYGLSSPVGLPLETLTFVPTTFFGQIVLRAFRDDFLCRLAKMPNRTFLPGSSWRNAFPRSWASALFSSGRLPPLSIVNAVFGFCGRLSARHQNHLGWVCCRICSGTFSPRHRLAVLVALSEPVGLYLIPHCCVRHSIVCCLRWSSNGSLCFMMWVPLLPRWQANSAYNQNLAGRNQNRAAFANVSAHNFQVHRLLPFFGRLWRLLNRGPCRSIAF